MKHLSGFKVFFAAALTALVFSAWLLAQPATQPQEGERIKTKSGLTIVKVAPGTGAEDQDARLGRVQFEDVREVGDGILDEPGFVDRFAVVETHQAAIEVAFRGIGAQSDGPLYLGEQVGQQFWTCPAVYRIEEKSHGTRFVQPLVGLEAGSGEQFLRLAHATDGASLPEGVGQGSGGLD